MTRCGDRHIEPVSHSIDFDRLGVPESIDLVATNGDVVNRNDPKSLAKGWEFFRRVERSRRSGRRDPWEPRPTGGDPRDGRGGCVRSRERAQGTPLIAYINS